MKNKIKLIALVITALFFFSTLYGMSENSINRSFIKNSLLVLAGGVMALFGLKSRGPQLPGSKEPLASKEAMHWKNLAG